MTETDPSLDTLARARPGPLKAFADRLSGALEPIEVIESRPGLVMLPMRDTAEGTPFHLGEVLVSEAHIRARDVDGYGVRRGRDLEAAMAMALVDLALSLNIEPDACRDFLADEARAQ
ncbi:MAG TPA: phosphonate C-P lyase system protein PhnG, partial [Rhodobacterales bacterium]|nr:phosphonate C-P lyase system protein PhnG [Rhodobacterales bacterium]